MKRILCLLLAVCTHATAAEFKLYPANGGDRGQFEFLPGGEGSEAWRSVDEAGAHDGNASIAWSTDFDLRQSFVTSSVPNPLPGMIDTLRVLIVARNRVGTVTMYALVDTLGANTEQLSAGHAYGTSFDSGWFAWASCPWTGAAWTRQNLADLEFGIRSGVPGPADSAVVTQCNVTVVYTPDRRHFKRRRLSRASNERSMEHPVANSCIRSRGEQ